MRAFLALALVVVFAIFPSLAAQAEAPSLFEAYLARSGGMPDPGLGFGAYLETAAAEGRAVTAFDRELAAILPLLADFQPGEGWRLLTGRLGKAWRPLPDLVLPAGSRIGIERGESLVFSTTFDFDYRGWAVEAGGPIWTSLGFEAGRGFHLRELQLRKEAVIGGVPVAAPIPFDFWDANLSLHPDGSVRRGVLSGDFERGGMRFGKGDRLEFDRAGAVVAVALAADRELGGRRALAWSAPGTDRHKGLNADGAPRPNLYLSGGAEVGAFREGFVVGGKVLEGPVLVRYGEGGRPLGLWLPLPLFLEYPVRPTWLPDWNGAPQDMVELLGETARIRLDRAVELSGPGGRALVPAGAELVVELSSGSCLAYTPEGGVRTSFSGQAAMRPPALKPDEKVERLLAWQVEWLDAHPELLASRDWQAQLRERLRDSLSRELAFRRQEEGIVKELLRRGLLRLERPGAGLVAGNAALDLELDGATLAGDRVPSAGPTISPAEILDALAARMDKLSRPAQELVLRAAFEGGSKSYRPEEISPRQRALELGLGAPLSKKGVHPLKDLKVYFLPDGSGNKAVGVPYVRFWKSGTIRDLKSLNDGSVKSDGTGEATMVVILPDGRDVEARDADFYEASGRLSFVAPLRGAVTTALPGGERICCLFQNFFESGLVRSIGGVWGGQGIVLPGGISVRAFNALSYFDNLKPEHLYCYEGLVLPLKAGQSFKGIDLRGMKETQVTVSKDRVLSGDLDCKLWFTRQGALKDISYWSDSVRAAVTGK